MDRQTGWAQRLVPTLLGVRVDAAGPSLVRPMMVGRTLVFTGASALPPSPREVVVLRHTEEEGRQ